MAYINGKDILFSPEVNIIGENGGIDTSDANATAADILSGKTAYVKGSKITGTHECEEGLDTSDATAGAGDILSGKTAYVKGSKVTGNIPTRTQPTPVITVLSDGLISATVTQAAGYVTAGSNGSTKQLPTLGAQTITPTTTDQTIASGNYLTGAQTIKGDANLVSANIKKGVVVFGVTGTMVEINNQNKTITANGKYTADNGYTGLGEVTVAVPETVPNLQEKTATANGEVVADSGYDGLSKVTVNVASGGGGDNRLPLFFARKITEVTEDDLAGVTSIPTYALVGQNKLTKITIPATVTEVQGETSETGSESYQTNPVAMKECYKLVEIANKSALTKSELKSLKNYALHVYDPSAEESWLHMTDDGFVFCVMMDAGGEKSYIEYEGTPLQDYSVNQETYLWGISLTVGETVYIEVDGVEYSAVVEGADSDSGEYYDHWYAGGANWYSESNYISFSFSDYNSHTISLYTKVSTGNEEPVVTARRLICYQGDSTSVTLPENYEGNAYTLHNYIFANEDTLTNISFPNTITAIPDYAFYKSKSLQNFTIPDAVTSIGQYAFSNSAFKNIVVGSGVTALGEYAFQECSSLETITLSDNLTRIGNNAFSSCSALTSVDIPANVTEIGNNAFSSCSSLASVTLHEGLVKIGTDVFMSCVNLTAITIPSTVTEIGSFAFWFAGSGMVITMLPTTPPTLGSNAFLDSYLSKIIVPTGCGDAYKAATNWSNFASKIEEA